MLNIIVALRAQLALLKASVFAKAGTLADLERDVARLRSRALLISERNNEQANLLENQRAELQAQIEALDAEADEASLIAVGASRLLGQ